MSPVSGGGPGLAAKKHPELDRKIILATYVAQLGLVGDHAKLAVPETVELSPDRVFRFERWETSLIRDVAEAGDPPMELIYHGIACRLACQKGLARCEDPATATAPELKEKVLETVAELAVILAVQQGLQRAIDRNVLAGRLELAKSLTRFRSKLSGLVAELRIPVGAENLAWAESWAGELVAPLPEVERRRCVKETPLPKPGELPAPLTRKRPGKKYEDTPVQATYHRREFIQVRHVRQEKDEPSNRARLLLLFLGLSLLVFAIQHLVLEQKSEIPVLQMSDFESVELVREIKARPPSLFLVVDARQWAAMDEATRRETLDHFAAVAATAGYLGINVKNSDSLTVGRWLKKRGTQLIEEDPSPPGS